MDNLIIAQKNKSPKGTATRNTGQRFFDAKKDCPLKQFGKLHNSILNEYKVCLSCGLPYCVEEKENDDADN